MPIYEFMCRPCNYRTEEIRSMADYTPTTCPGCDGKTEWIVSSPTMHIWDGERSFANLTQHGDGTVKFATKSDYNMHLKQNHVTEADSSFPIKHSHVAQVTVYD